MRDHMMGWVLPAESPGAPIRPLTPASKAQDEASAKEFAVLAFEQGDHMLPGMKQSDFPKEYDTREVIDDRSLEAYNRAMRETANTVCNLPVFGVDLAQPGADATVTGMALLMKAGDERQRRIVAAFKPKPLKWWHDLLK